MYIPIPVFWIIILVIVFLFYALIKSSITNTKAKRISDDIIRAYNETTARLVRYVWEITTPKKKDETLEAFAMAMFNGAKNSVTTRSLMDLTDILSLSIMFQSFNIREELTPPILDDQDDKMEARIKEDIMEDLSKWLGHDEDT